MTPPTDIETRLRACLSENARHAPPAAALADRILAELDAPVVLRPRLGWRTWTFPMLAAAAIAAVALTVVGIDGPRHTAAPVPPRTHPAASPQLSSSPSSAAPSTSAPPSASPSASNPVPTTGFRAFDVTFVGTADGWALGSEPCIADPVHRCTAILRTTDGKHWSGIGGESFNVSDVKGCSYLCVQHIRFASPTIGYAYGVHALFMTTNGGASWVQQNGLGADALETLSGNVILVRAVNTGSALYERAPIGTSAWTQFKVPGFFPTIGVALARSGHDAILAPIDYNPAHPTPASPTLYWSRNDGATWSKTASACPSVGAGDVRQVTAATIGTDGTVVVACATTTRTNLVGSGATAISTDGGRTFHSPPNGGKLPVAELIAAADNGIQLVVVRGTMYRSTDSGNSWKRVPELHNVTFVGFEDGQDGRAVADDGRTIWVTHDAGATWSGGAFSG